MRSTTALIRIISALAVLAGIATLAILVLPTGLQGSVLADRAQVGAAISSAFALILSILAIIITARVSSSDFRAEEDVKAQTAQLLACLRCIIVKGARLSKLPPNTPANIDFKFERTLLSGFLTSTTAFAYWSWVAHKSQVAKDRSEKWRTFFLDLVGILDVEDADHQLMRKRAIDLERLLDELRTRDIAQIAGYVSDLARSVHDFAVVREKDPFTKVAFTVPEESDTRKDEAFRRKLLYLKQRGIQDPNIDLFLSVLDSDVNLVKAALDAGADPSVTDSEVVARYSDELRDFQDTP
jgi:hypothetical protein